MHRRAPHRLLSLGVIAAAAVAGVAAPAIAQATDPAFDAVRSRYTRLVTAITDGGGLYEQDRPVVRSVLRDIAAYLADNPQDVRALAMDLQLSRWLDEDQDRITANYAQLEALRPNDPAIALAALRWRTLDGQIVGDALAEAWAGLSARFPQNAEIALEHVRRLKDQIRYEDMINAVERLDVEPSAQPELFVLLAEARFAEHRFEAALAALDDIGQLGAMQFRLRTRADELRGWIEDTRAAWGPEQETRAAEASADDLPRATIETVRGSITVELFENDAPNTVANFISLAESGFYAGTTFHRFIPDFMVQGGDANSKEGVEGTPGTGNPGYRIPDEHGEGFSARRHFNDTLAMANTGAANSGGSQFYLTHKPTPWLNDRHTVFGRVIDGQHIARRLRADDRITGVTIIRKRDHAYVPETIALEAATPPAPAPAPDPAPEADAAGDPVVPPAEGGEGG
jgi:cyclophilin family peptidyl-prolyl cis-trans isomerase